MTTLALLTAIVLLAADKPVAELNIDGTLPAVAGPVAVKADVADGICILNLPGGKTAIGQADFEHNIWFWWNAGEKPLPPRSVEVDPPREGATALNVRIDGKLFTTFNMKPDESRPYLYPVIGPTGDPVTRDWPMKDNPEEGKKRQDHPHHRSIWTAYGDIRLGEAAKKGTDYWATEDDKTVDGKRTVTHKPTAGWQKVRKVSTATGPVFGEITADVDWVTADGKRELSDTRTYRFFRGSKNSVVFDYKIVLHFPEGDVTFGDTKEGGIIAVRVATTMDETAKKGGHMVNSEGGKGMKECWGKAAAWCDYVGPVGKKTVGIAVFDAPTNLGHPARWHIRDYGLYTVNPFGLRDYTGDKTKDGSHTFKKGESSAFAYRVIIHEGETKEAGIAEQYKLFAEPPKLTAGK